LVDTCAGSDRDDAVDVVETTAAAIASANAYL
jgi:hypothetical protein